MLQERFDPSEARGRILRGEAAATPSPVKQIRSAPFIDSKADWRAGAPELVVPSDGGITPLGSPEADALRSRMEVAELKMASVSFQQSAGPDLAAALEAQTKALVDGLAQRKRVQIFGLSHASHGLS